MNFFNEFIKTNNPDNQNVTLMNDPVIGAIQNDAYQLYRCPHLKNYEADLLLQLPYNHSFLDIGAHFGDTSFTMALYAKNNNRSDIRFFAFEPCKEKCDYITKISNLNNLNIHVFNVGVGDKNCKIIPHHYKDTLKGTITYLHDDNGFQDMISLDSINNQIEPVGFMHIDVEGWESKVLEGANTIINNNNTIIVTECWDPATSLRLGFNENPEKQILDVMNQHKKYKQLPDIVDHERNLVFFSKHCILK